MSPREDEGDPLKGTLLNPSYGSLKRGLIPKGRPNPNLNSALGSVQTTT